MPKGRINILSEELSNDKLHRTRKILDEHKTYILVRLYSERKL